MPKKEKGPCEDKSKNLDLFDIRYNQANKFRLDLGLIRPPKIFYSHILNMNLHFNKHPGYLCTSKSEKHLTKGLFV